MGLQVLEGHKDNLICAVLVLEDAVVVKTVMLHFALEAQAMRTTYYEEDDTLVLHLSDKPIAREASQDWNTHISYAADGSIVQMVFLEASGQGVLPVEVRHGKAVQATPRPE